MPHPDWLPQGSDDTSLSQPLLTALAERNQAWLVGGDAARRLALAGRIMTSWDDAVVARLTGCRGAADALLIIGEALHAPIPGSAVSVGSLLRQCTRMLIIIDGADAPNALDACAQLEALAPAVSWLLLADTIPEHAPAAQVTLPPSPTAPISSDVHEDVQLLTMLPAGLPSSLHVPAELRHPTPPRRMALHAHALSTLRTQLRLEPSRLAQSLLPRFAHVLVLADGAPLPSGVCVADMLALRWMGEVLSEPSEAARATTAAGRLLSMWGQPEVARRLLGSGLRRDALASPSCRARLLWAEGDALMACGNRTGAEQCYQEAEQHLVADQNVALLVAMTRRLAMAHACRGQSQQAAQRYQHAQALSRQLAPTHGATTLRATADLAVARGELLSAAALYDQAESLPATELETLNRRLGRAGLALAQGEMERAKALLRHELTIDLPVLQGNLARRRADLALRQRQYEAAQSEAEAALAAYAHAGERAAMGHTTRLLGDIHATSGKLQAASEYYLRAIPLQIEAGDLAGLRQTIRHTIALERQASTSSLGPALTALLEQLEDNV